jgi:hypothetical protein
MTENVPEWKRKALSDPNLSERHWTILKLGPSSLAEAFILQAIKFKYTK